MVVMISTRGYVQRVLMSERSCSSTFARVAPLDRSTRLIADSCIVRIGNENRSGGTRGKEK